MAKSGKSGGQAGGGPIDLGFARWWVGRVQPFVEVPEEKLAAEREAVERLREYNDNYLTFMKDCVLPAIDALQKMLARDRVVHRVSTWGNQLSVRVHLAWRWGELVITQSHEDAVTFEHHIITEGERRDQDTSEDHNHQYDLRDPLPPAVAQNELYFFLGRLAQDLVEYDEPELPPGESKK
jgi:hypothetical protein